MSHVASPKGARDSSSDSLTDRMAEASVETLKSKPSDGLDGSEQEAVPSSPMRLYSAEEEAERAQLQGSIIELKSLMHSITTTTTTSTNGASLDLEIDQFTHVLDALERCAQIRRECKTLQQTVSMLEARLREAENNEAQSLREKEFYKVELEMVRDQLNVLNEQLRKDRESAEVNSQKFDRELNRLREEKDHTMQMLMVEQKRSVQFESTLLATVTKRDELQARHDELLAKQDHSEMQIRELLGRKAEHMEAIATLKARVEELLLKLNTSQSETAKLLYENGELKSKLDSALDNSSAQFIVLKELEEKLRATEQQTEVLGNTVTTDQDAIDEFREQIETLTAQNETYCEMVVEMEIEKKLRAESHAQIQSDQAAKIAMLEGKIRDLEIQVTVYQKKVSALPTTPVRKQSEARMQQADARVDELELLLETQRRKFEDENNELKKLLENQANDVRRMSDSVQDVFQRGARGGRFQSVDDRLKNIEKMMDDHENSAAFRATIELLKGQVIPLNRDGLALLEHELRMIDARTYNRTHTFNTAHSIIKTSIIAATGKDMIPTRKWVVTDEELFGIQRHKQRQILHALQQLVISYDNSNTEDLDRTTVSEVIANADVLVRLAEVVKKTVAGSAKGLAAMQKIAHVGFTAHNDFHSTGLSAAIADNMRRVTASPRNPSLPSPPQGYGKDSLLSPAPQGRSLSPSPQSQEARRAYSPTPSNDSSEFDRDYATPEPQLTSFAPPVSPAQVSLHRGLQALMKTGNTVAGGTSFARGR